MAATREFILAFHDIFVLDENKLGCMSAIEHEICINNSEPFKEQFWHIPLLLLEEVHALLRDMLDAGVIHLSQSPWCNVVVLVKKKTELCASVWTFRLNMCTKKDSYLLPQKHGGCHAFFNNGL